MVCKYSPGNKRRVVGEGVISAFHFSEVTANDLFSLFHFFVRVCYLSDIVIIVPTQYFGGPLLKGFYDASVVLAVGFAVSAVWFDVCKRINFSLL